MMTQTTARIRRQTGTLDGMEAAQRDAAKCNTPADVAWLRRVAQDALADTPYWSGYKSGYDHVLAALVA